jgi:uncharacterized protein (DUF1697 family)
MTSTDSEVFIAFIRGINVVGHRIIKMNDLKHLHEAMGHGKIATYLQSGNIIFECKEYEKDFGFQTDTIIRNFTDLTNILKACPFSPRVDLEAKFLHVVQFAGFSRDREY